MSQFIAFLRAINVGHGRTLKMASLRRFFESLGFSEVTTLTSSGNVVFETRAKNVKRLEIKIEKKLREALGYDVAVLIRSDAELAKIANYKPFPKSKIDSAAEFNIIFLKNRLDDKLKRKIIALRTDTNEFRVHGREIYWLRRKKPNSSNFSTPPLEKMIGKPFTIRGAKTVKKMAKKYSASGP